MRMHFESITEALKSNLGALQSLTLKVKAKGWHTTTSKPSADSLLSLIINRIKLNAHQFGEFNAMLDDVEGMDLVVEKLKSED